MRHCRYHRPDGRSDRSRRDVPAGLGDGTYEDDLLAHALEPINEIVQRGYQCAIVDIIDRTAAQIGVDATFQPGSAMGPMRTTCLPMRWSRSMRSSSADINAPLSISSTGRPLRSESTRRSSRARRWDL